MTRFPGIYISSDETSWTFDFPFIWNSPDVEVWTDQICRVGEAFVARIYSVMLDRTAYDPVDHVLLPKAALSIAHARLFYKFLGGDFSMLDLSHSFSGTDYDIGEDKTLSNPIIFGELAHMAFRMRCIRPPVNYACTISFKGTLVRSK